jgi:hypothetical protein
MAAIDTYLAQPDSKHIIIAEITRASGKKYYLSSEPYITEATDVPANFQFTPIIGANGLPRVKRSLTDPLLGGASTSYGSLTLTDDYAAFNNGGTYGRDDMDVFRGNVVTVKMTGPRHLFAYADAVTLFTGKVGRVSKGTDGEVVFEILDGANPIRDTTIPMTAYAAGGYKPQAYGRVYNITPVLEDKATLKYRVHDGRVNAISAVYDRGVSVAFTANLTDGSFTLNSSPSGDVAAITADVEGDAPSGVWNDSTQDVVSRLLDVCGITTGVIPRSYSGDPSDVIGYYITEPEQLGDAITKLLRGAGCWWAISRNGTFTVKALPLPAGGGTAYGETKLLGESSYEAEDRVIRSVLCKYRKNWTVQSNLAFGAGEAQLKFASSEGLSTTVTTTGDESESTTEELETFFADSSPAAAAGTRVLDLYKNRRFIFNVTLPAATPALEPGALVSLESPKLPGSSSFADAYVLSVTDIIDGAFPVYEVEAIA